MTDQKPDEPQGATDRVTGFDRTVFVDAPPELGHHRLTRMLGRGGMGEVWLAFDTKLEREVAIKLMRRELLSDDEAVKRFYREARAVAKLNHPNIVQVYSIGEEQGVIYFAMELVEGITVTDRLKSEGPIPLDECVMMLVQAIEGLSYANAQGIIHRDIKPSNLMLTNDFRMKIADFGLAKMVTHDTQITAAGTTMGSPNYMSPEQARGQEADHRSDMYSLGITFYQMLTGTLPFTAQTPLSVLLKHIQDPLPEPEFLHGLSGGKPLAVIKKMTAKNPEERYQTYGGLAAAIAALSPKAQLHPGTFVPTSSLPTPATRIEPVQDGAVGTEAAPASQHTLMVERRRAATPGAAAPAAGQSRQGLFIGAAVAAVVVVFGAAFLLKDQFGGTRDGRRQVEPAPTVSATASPTAVQPTLTPMQVPVILVTVTPTAQTPAVTATPAATPSLTPTPAPTPVPAGELLIGGERAVPGMLVPVYDEQGQRVRDLRVGTRIADFRMMTDGTRYRINDSEGVGFVKRDDAQLVYGSVASAPQVAAGGQVVWLVIGTQGAGANEEVPVFTRSDSDKEVTRLKAGTVVRCIEQTAVGYVIAVPNGRQGFVFRKSAQIKR